MIDASDDSITPATSSLYFRQLTSESSTSTNGVKHITLGRALVISRSVIIKLNEPLQNTDRLIFSATD